MIMSEVPPENKVPPAPAGEVSIGGEATSPEAQSAAVTAVKSSGSGVCVICQTPVGLQEPMTTCPACHAPYHYECWQDNGGCGVYGCSQVPPIEQRRSIEIPLSYWGQENKPCPACGKEILAAAVRCRHCGATFASAQPEDTNAFQHRTALQERLPKIRQTIVWMFICSILPCTAPVGGIWGVVWYPSHKQEVQALPAVYQALCKIGIGVGLGQTGLIVLMAVLHSMRPQL